MGQQQLLLLVLSIVIVGLAVAVGIDAFLKNRRQAEADMVVYNLVRLASAAQEWKLKPAAFGGGQDAAGYEAVGNGFTGLGWPTVQRTVTTRNPDTGQPSTERTDCYQPNLNTLYCTVPQMSGRRSSGQLFIYAMSNLLNQTGSSFSSSSMNLIATAVVTGTSPESLTVTVVR